jgi:hypothetical protein
VGGTGNAHGFSLPVVILVSCFCKSWYAVRRIVIKMGLSFVIFLQGRKTEIVQFSYDDYILVSLFLSVPFCPQIQCFSGLQVL